MEHLGIFHTASRKFLSIVCTSSSSCAFICSEGLALVPLGKPVLIFRNFEGGSNSSTKSNAVSDQVRFNLLILFKASCLALPFGLLSSYVENISNSASASISSVVLYVKSVVVHRNPD